MSDVVKQLIKEHAERIRAELVKEGYIQYLYGEPLDTSDPDAILVAAVAMTEWKAVQQRLKEIELTRSFLGRY